MAMMDFIRKQFVDVVEWLDRDGDTVAWRFPFADREIQNGAQLTVRDSQVAVFIDEGRIADVFAAGRYRLTTQTLPLLTNLRNWDKAFESPFKSDVLFITTRPQLDRRWGTPLPVAVRDADFGAVRVRAFGNFAWRVSDPRSFYREVAGTRDRVGSQDLDAVIRAMLVQHLADAVASSGLPFLDLAANLVEFAQQLATACRDDAARLGVAVESVTVQSITLPDELQKLLDQRSGMSMVGPDMARFVQYQAGQSMPLLAGGAADAGAPGGGGPARPVADAMGLGAGLAMGQLMAQQLQSAAPAPAGVRPEDVLSTLERLGELHVRGVLTDAEFAAKKAELLRKLG